MLAFHYLDSIDIRDIPRSSMEEIREEAEQAVRSGQRIVQFCGMRDWESSDKIAVLCVSADDGTGDLQVWMSHPMSEGDSYACLTDRIPQVHLFERALYEQWGIRPEGHPWLKPVYFCIPAGGTENTRPIPSDTDFFSVSGSQVHEVAVGPIHAGVIEPGHFRFQCHGEEVMHLEISLGFQHRGVENSLVGGPTPRTRHLFECLCGDSSIAHGTAYASLTETMTKTEVSPKAESLRRILLELERLACHTGDLGAIAGDTGFLPTSAYCGRIRGDWLNTTAFLCGNRFGRDAVRPGGLMFDADRELMDTIFSRTQTIERDMRGAVDLMFSSNSVLDRMQNTGIVQHQTAVELGLVGVAARAAGIPMDARFNYPLNAHRETRARLRTQNAGDVFCRAAQRYAEAADSTAIIYDEIEKIDLSAAPCVMSDSLPTLPSFRLALSFTEGWRGTVCHMAVTDGEGKFALYKPVDPSFHNWMGLAMALRGEQISDFPLCNKSFNLSYCGHDL